MKNRSQILLWISLVVCVVVGAIWQIYPLADAQERISKIPLKGDNFNGRDVPLEPWEKSFFKDVNIVKRIYDFNGQQYFVTVLDGTNNRHVVHDPFYCFTGSGWELVGSNTTEVSGGYVEIMVLKRGMEKKEAMVWFTDGKERYASASTYFLQTTLRRISLGMTGDEPLLVVIQPVDSQNYDWKKILEDGTFIRSL